MSTNHNLKWYTETISKDSKKATPKDLEDYIKSVPLEKTVFLIGSGPSLKNMDMSLLKGLNTIGMNRQYISYKDWGFYPKHYFCIDERLAKSITDKDSKIPYEDQIYPYMVDNPECTTETYCLYHTNVREPDTVFHERISPNELWAVGRGEVSFKCIEGKHQELGTIFAGNCGAFATLLSFFYGYERVVLLGINAEYQGRSNSVDAGKDLDHYDSNYFKVGTFNEGENQGSNDKTSGMYFWFMMSRWSSAKSYESGEWEPPNVNYVNSDCDIISCTPNSVINVGHNLDSGNITDPLGRLRDEDFKKGCFPFFKLEDYLNIIQG
tara:strand:+ start:386 stop:1354 length:969 start_codon:yes stop_codon:yes gene_type:complete